MRIASSDSIATWRIQISPSAKLGRAILMGWHPHSSIGTLRPAGSEGKFVLDEKLGGNSAATPAETWIRNSAKFEHTQGSHRACLAWVRIPTEPASGQDWQTPRRFRQFARSDSRAQSKVAPRQPSCGQFHRTAWTAQRPFQEQLRSAAELEPLKRFSSAAVGWATQAHAGRAEQWQVLTLFHAPMPGSRVPLRVVLQH